MSMVLSKSILAFELAAELSLEVTGCRDQPLVAIATIDSMEPNTLKFSKIPPNEYLSGIVIAPSTCNAETVLISENPRLDFCKALNFLLDKHYLVRPVMESSVGHNCYIADSAILEDGVTIGANCIVEHNVVIHRNTSIGENCIIRANSVIGAQGFGFQQDSDGTWIRFPHLGGVVIENNVEIGALNSVCLGSLGNTTIGAGVKTDNLVHIGHNCTIGDNTILTASSELSGGVTLGANVWIGPNSSIMEKVSIASNSMVGIGSVVRKNVAKGIIVAGNPAKKIRDNM